MVIKVLGSGCKSCMNVYETFKKVARDNKDIEIIKVTDFKEIAKYKVMNMPAVVIDEKVVLTAKIPNEKQAEVLIKDNTTDIETCECGENCD